MLCFRLLSRFFYRLGTGGGAPRFGSGGGAPLGGGAGGGAAPLLASILPDGVPGVVVDEEEALLFSSASFTKYIM